MMRSIKRILLGGLAGHLACGAAMAGEPRVIATNCTPVPRVPVAVLGAPSAAAPVPEVAVVTYNYTAARGQSADGHGPALATSLPMPAPVAGPTPAAAAAPQPAWPTPAATPVHPYPAAPAYPYPTGPVPIATNTACTTCNPPPFDPSVGVLPGGPALVGFPGMVPEGERPRIYGSADYLLWFIRDGFIPPLVSTGLPRPLAPAYDQFLVDNGSLDRQGRFGSRVQLGYWSRCLPDWGIVGSFFFLGQRSVDDYYDTTRTPALGRPFINAGTGALDTNYVGIPGLFTGNVAYEVTNNLWGADINIRRPFACGWLGRIDWIAGYRYLRFEEELAIYENSTALQKTQLVDFNGNVFDVIPAGTGRSVNDRFDVTNEFHGGQIGLLTERRIGRWSFDLSGKVALGTTRSRLAINGAETLIVPVDSGPTPPAATIAPGTYELEGGLLARPSNIGVYTRNNFTVVPEIGLNVGYFITPNMKFTVGYTFLYWSNILRAGDQIDTTVNTAGIPLLPPTNSQAARPKQLMKETDFWAQGLNFGFSYQW